MYSVQMRQKVVELRRQGLSLNELAARTAVPKTTIQNWVHQVELTPFAQIRLQKRIRNGILKANTSRRIAITLTRAQKRSTELTTFLGHCLFDGSVLMDRVVYYSSHKTLAQNFAEIGSRLFGLHPHWQLAKNDVYRVNFYARNLTEFVRLETPQLLEKIEQMSLGHRRAFLRAFFDDEGTVTFRPEKHWRKVRGYQKDVSLLELIQRLLAQYNIVSSIESMSGSPEIVIRQKESIIRFANEINFSTGAVFRATRSNSYYTKSISKREVLKALIASY